MPCGHLIETTNSRVSAESRSPGHSFFNGNFVDKAVAKVASAGLQKPTLESG